MILDMLLWHYHIMIKKSKYDKEYSCIVASKNNEILDILEKFNLS